MTELQKPVQEYKDLEKCFRTLFPPKKHYFNMLHFVVKNEVKLPKKNKDEKDLSKEDLTKKYREMYESERDGMVSEKLELLKKDYLHADEVYKESISKYEEEKKKYESEKTPKKKKKASSKSSPTKKQKMDDELSNNVEDKKYLRSISAHTDKIFTNLNDEVFHETSKLRRKINLPVLENMDV